MTDKIYPRWIFSPQYADRIVNSPEEEEALGPGWYDTSADFPVDETPLPVNPGPCPYCTAYKDRIAALEEQIVELEKAKE
jgi:hypothetical protein